MEKIEVHHVDSMLTPGEKLLVGEVKADIKSKKPFVPLVNL